MRSLNLDSSGSDRGIRSKPAMKHSNQMNGDQSIHTNHSTTMERIISSGVRKENDVGKTRIYSANDFLI